MIQVNEATQTRTITTTIEGDILTLTFADGRVLVFDTTKPNEENQRAAKIHGVKQKLCDAAAISRNPETGKSATLADKYAAVKEVYDRLLDPMGTWNKTREGGSGGGGGLLLQALFRMYEGKKSLEALRTYLEGKTPLQHAALRKNPKVSAIIDTIRLERAGEEAIDTDALLDELDA